MDAPDQLPNWAKNKKAFWAICWGCGLSLMALSIAASLISPDIVKLTVKIIATTLAPLLLLAAIVVGGLRRAVLGPSRNFSLRPNAWLLSYVLFQLAATIAMAGLIAPTALAWMFGWDPWTRFVPALAALTLLFVTIMFAMKLFVNAQLLVRHFLSRDRARTE